jgi:hypothetical protein
MTIHQIGADQWRKHMTKNLVLAGALLAALASPAFAEDPYNANDSYNSDARHLNAETQGADAWAQSWEPGSTAMSQPRAGEAFAYGRPSRTIVAPNARYLPDRENEGGKTGVSGGAAN